MGRSRSRSPPRRERRRSRSTSRERERRRRERSRSRERERRRSRSRSPHRRRSRSPRRHRSSSSSPSRQKDEKKEIKDSKGKERQITEEDLEGKTEEEIEMMKTMGFSTFDTTKSSQGTASKWFHSFEGGRPQDMLRRLLFDLMGISLSWVHCILFTIYTEMLENPPEGKKVEGSVNAYAINVSQKRKYRQYMNRKGGFNRPLDFIA